MARGRWQVNYIYNFSSTELAPPIANIQLILANFKMLNKDDIQMAAIGEDAIGDPVLIVKTSQELDNPICCFAEDNGKDHLIYVVCTGIEDNIYKLLLPYPNRWSCHFIDESNQFRLFIFLKRDQYNIDQARELQHDLMYNFGRNGVKILLNSLSSGTFSAS